MLGQHCWHIFMQMKLTVPTESPTTIMNGVSPIGINDTITHDQQHNNHLLQQQNMYHKMTREKRDTVAFAIHCIDITYTLHRPKMLYDEWNLTIKSIYFVLSAYIVSGPLESLGSCRLNPIQSGNLPSQPIWFYIDVVEHANKIATWTFCNRCCTSSNNNAFSK